MCSFRYDTAYVDELFKINFVQNYKTSRFALITETSENLPSDESVLACGFCREDSDFQADCSMFTNSLNIDIAIDNLSMICRDIGIFLKEKELPFPATINKMQIHLLKVRDDFPGSSDTECGELFQCGEFIINSEDGTYRVKSPRPTNPRFEESCVPEAMCHIEVSSYPAIVTLDANVKSLMIEEESLSHLGNCAEDSYRYA